MSAARQLLQQMFVAAIAAARPANRHRRRQGVGVDGQQEIAGAYLAPDTLQSAWAQGLRPKDSLANNDGHGFFGALGDAVVTGPTLTNVNDFRAILVTGRATQ